MNRLQHRSFARASGLLAIALFALGAQAAVTTYTSSASFLADTTTTNLATFEGLTTGSVGASLTTNGITITSLPGGHAIHDVYIAPASNVFFGVPNTSAVLTADGDENFRFQMTSGGTFGAIGFDFYSNPYGAPVFAFFDSSATLIASVSVPQTLSSLGYIGFTSTTPIAYITTTVDRGWQVDTAYDNLRIGSVTAVPEPNAGGLLLAGLAALTGLARRRAA
jgi:hypothetical protein